MFALCFRRVNPNPPGRGPANTVQKSYVSQLTKRTFFVPGVMCALIVSSANASEHREFMKGGVWKIDRGNIAIPRPRLGHWRNGILEIQIYCVGERSFDIYITAPAEVAIVDGRARNSDEIVEIQLLKDNEMTRKSAKASLSPHGGQSLINFSTQDVELLLKSSDEFAKLEIRWDGRQVFNAPVPKRKIYDNFRNSCRGIQ
jgi:hypothetical protein